MGTVSNAWHFIANDFEQTAEIHKLIAASMLEEIVKPLKVFGDIQHRTRKTTEALVEKRHKQLQDWRATEAKTFQTFPKSTTPRSKTNQKVTVHLKWVKFP